MYIIIQINLDGTETHYEYEDYQLPEEVKNIELAYEYGLIADYEIIKG